MKRYNKELCRISFYLLGVVAAGCSMDVKSNDSTEAQRTYSAIYTSEPLKVDGVLDEAIWKNSPAFELNLLKDEKEGGLIKESGRVRFAWDEIYFYLAAYFEDSDILAQGREDQMHHYRYGDVCELFLKPEQESYYWELYVTPLSKKTTFFFEDGSCLKHPECFENYHMGLVVAAGCDGQVNNQNGQDRSWTAEMAVPIKELEARGTKFAPGQVWRILVGRYNYWRGLQDRELSSAPQLSVMNFHFHEEYAYLNLVK